jgi:glutamine kinase
MKFKTKAQNLKTLKDGNFNIPSFTFFELRDFKKDNKKYITLIQKKLGHKVAVRSSNYYEDQSEKTFAGKFESVLNVETKKEKKLINAINSIDISYKNFEHPKNEILIQNMVKNVKYSGVIFTADPETGAPYYKINYTKSNDTTLVTSGNSLTETLIYYKHSRVYPKEIFLKKLILITKKILKFTKKNNLDIEFAITKNNIINILQIRELKINSNTSITNDYPKDYLKKLEKKINKLQNSHAHLLGKTTYFGVMPDWNPAEIIGIKPKPLDLSLYKELITDHVWAKNRKFFGYKDVTSSHLMTTFFGVPFVDLRVDFNSWLPKKLDIKISNKLINFYLKKFKKNLFLHDKIEFDLIHSSLNFSTEKVLNKQLKSIFKKKEIESIKTNLLEISKLTFQNFSKLKKDLKELDTRFKKINNSSMYMIDKIYWLIEDCKRFGTYPFAGFARCGFVAINFLKSMVENKIITSNEKELFLKSIVNITSDLQKDLYSLPKKKFLDKYGHIRPNTYDINSLNYKDGYSFYFKKLKKQNKKDAKFSFDKKVKSKLKIAIKKNKLDISPNELIDFIAESIKLRENSKFLFSKNVNSILGEIKKFGKRLNISSEDIAYLEIFDLINLYYTMDGNNLKEVLKDKIKINKKNYKNNTMVLLPEIITNYRDIYYFNTLPTKINFIGSNIVKAKITLVKNKHLKNLKLSNKIVLIEKADPGYDFLFTHDISGLITKYGGANSHMAIRCAELGIQAAIGIGEKKFDELLSSNIVEIDGQKQTLKKIL